MSNLALLDVRINFPSSGSLVSIPLTLKSSTLNVKTHSFLLSFRVTDAKTTDQIKIIFNAMNSSLQNADIESSMSLNSHQTVRLRKT